MKKVSPQPWPVRDNVARIFLDVVGERLSERLPLPSSIRDAIFFMKVAKRRNDVDGFITGVKLLADNFPSLSGPSLGFPPPSPPMSPEDRRAVEDFMNPPRRGRGRPRVGMSSKQVSDGKATADAEEDFMFSIALEVVSRCVAERRNEAELERLPDAETQKIVAAVVGEIAGFGFSRSKLDADAIRKRHIRR